MHRLVVSLRAGSAPCGPRAVTRRCSHIGPHALHACAWGLPSAAKARPPAREQGSVPTPSPYRSSHARGLAHRAWNPLVAGDRAGLRKALARMEILVQISGGEMSSFQDYFGAFSLNSACNARDSR
jgi:hypothetical protein